MWYIKVSWRKSVSFICSQEGRQNSSADFGVYSNSPCWRSQRWSGRNPAGIRRLWLHWVLTVSLAVLHHFLVKQLVRYNQDDRSWQTSYLYGPPPGILYLFLNIYNAALKLHVVLAQCVWISISSERSIIALLGRFKTVKDWSNALRLLHKGSERIAHTYSCIAEPYFIETLIKHPDLDILQRGSISENLFNVMICNRAVLV